MGGEGLGNNKKVVKFKKQKKINIGIIVFLIMFVYISINVSMYFTKDHISIYEVKEGQTAQDNVFTGLILRDEKIIKSEAAGYVSYYKKEGARVSKNSPIYSINENQQLMDVITSGEVPITLTEKNHAEMKHTINFFRKNYSDDNFSSVYDFKEDAKSTVQDILNTAVLEKGQAIEDETGVANSSAIYKSKKSGIVTYYKDSFENITEDNVTKEMFQSDKYKRNGLRTTKMVMTNKPIYKLVSSDEWSILLPLNTKQYEKLQNQDYITFTVLDDSNKMTAKLTLVQKGSDNYAKLTMDKNMSNYIEDRFLEIKLNFNSVSGLKIPISSVVEKDFYVIPLTYFSTGGNTKSDGIIKEKYSENGDVKYVFVPTDNYYHDGTLGYVEANLFPAGTWIKQAATSERYQLSKLVKLTGVYNVNMGYSVFKSVKILDKNNEYYIIDKNTFNGLSAYDHIALNGKSAVEQEIIY